MSLEAAPSSRPTLPKAPTGIAGFDDITGGGLPAGRPSLICGSAGSGKTLFATTFLVNGTTLFDEPGVFMSFEERSEDLAANVASLGYNLDKLVEDGRIAIDHVQVDRSDIEENGEYDLEGLFLRLGFAVDSVGAKRVVLDTIETLFSSFDNQAILRSELRRLFGWIKDRGLSCIITGERGEGQFTRQDLEEYVSDCVVLLDNRVHEQITTRRLRVVKYRGSAHGTNEYPFLIDAQGISVLPVTGAGLSHGVSSEVVSTGIPGLDAMLGQGGFFRGTSLLLTGTAGTGKTSFSSTMVNAACERGERCMMFVFEESAAQVVRNARSIGLDLQRHADAGLLRFEAARPSLYGLEMHLARMHRDVEAFGPQLVVIDPITAFRGPEAEVQSVLLRMVDLLKARGITGIFTSLMHGGTGATIDADADLGMSSLMDAWVRLTHEEANGEINRTLYIIKARGMSHSNQVREYQMSEAGIGLIEPYIGPEGVLTGSARLSQVAREQAAALRRQQEIERRRREIARRRAAVDRQIQELRAALEAEEQEVTLLHQQDQERESALARDRQAMARHRTAAE
ncbi:KaiC family protein [Pseudoroseomonas oryzae]|uniref:non-specific serine/threonine protein kinase n=2 Tax=Teichococcus oryzae TaxID=1608942 RepID=A0A5B2TNK8_9PROT|nr:KaiC family protein [Pseudoroseomonas oryzae]